MAWKGTSVPPALAADSDVVADTNFEASADSRIGAATDTLADMDTDEGWGPEVDADRVPDVDGLWFLFRFLRVWVFLACESYPHTLKAAQS